MEQAKPTIIYDGECPFCLRQISRIQRKDESDLFEYLPRQTPRIEERFPVLRESDFNTGMRLVAPDGRVFVGADAVYQIAHRLPGWRMLAWIYTVPGSRWLLRKAYAWVAANRTSIGRHCDDNLCESKSRNL